MQVIICGAGQVGYGIAEYLAAEKNDVVVVDQSPHLVRKIDETLDVQGIVGSASTPDVLLQAGAADCDLLIAVTHSDEVNMIACQVAHSLFNVPTKIARVRNQSYLQPRWAALFGDEHLPIDVVISPEIEVARSIERRLQTRGAFENIPLADGKVRVVGVAINDNCPISHTPLRQLTSLFPNLAAEVIGIVRNDRLIVPTADDQLLPGDQAYFAVEVSHLPRAMAAFGHEAENASSVVILGGGHIGTFLAEDIDRRHKQMTVRVIEVDNRRATYISQRLNRAIILLGDGLDLEILREAHVDRSEMFIAVSNADETNILAALQAKRLGSGTVVSLINNFGFAGLVSDLGIDAVVNPRVITISTILQHVRRGKISAVHSLRDGTAEILELEALSTAPVIGKQIKDLRFPSGVKIGVIVRGGTVLIPKPSTEIKIGDHVVLISVQGMVKKVEAMFSVKVEFF
jgi:trk system potassium uptake protein TrkA